ncbi:hypothetical protein DFH07DRAFT_359536 [Mycena maculata]|uniref:Uncharacterized protein n=1 Tax=Mycena maculata TaxID=230809 RepID=A0AAD7JJS6_9AGAR|nr:hypothetical protein DFH07DRAFT_359536 [Mycena maculata]
MSRRSHRFSFQGATRSSRASQAQTPRRSCRPSRRTPPGPSPRTRTAPCPCSFLQDSDLLNAPFKPVVCMRRKQQLNSLVIPRVEHVETPPSPRVQSDHFRISNGTPTAQFADSASAALATGAYFLGSIASGQNGTGRNGATGISKRTQRERWKARGLPLLDHRMDGAIIVCACPTSRAMATVGSSGHVRCFLRLSIPACSAHPGSPLSFSWPSLRPHLPDDLQLFCINGSDARRTGTLRRQVRMAQRVPDALLREG